MLSMSRLSREYVFVDIETVDDLSTATSEVAFMAAEAIPTVSDWHPADLVGTWSVRILVGPGSANAVELAPGDYQIWVKIIDFPEAPVRRPGMLVIE